MMYEVFVVAIIFVAGFHYFYKILELYAMRKERILMIEKLYSFNCGIIPDLPKIKSDLQIGSNSALKGACLLIGLGVGVLVGYVLVALLLENPGTMDFGGDVSPGYLRGYNAYQEMKFMIIAASVLVFGGGGLLAAFFSERRFGKQEKE